ncbi:transcription factor SRM1-like isoform X2 [Cornus florida]|uniref:transcription factor SRM1-like isoform X2 n=1 Tax=Cornus florida TaxID=4283 RepID=UPI0028A29F76|nr:transcription factor SRM1-like isoform X2 [Cornus florida]
MLMQQAISTKDKRNIFLTHCLSKRMSMNGACSSSVWTREQDKAFENALAIYSEDLSDRWEKIAAAVPGKTLEEIKHHYNILVEDVNAIESGLVPLPSYVSSFDDSANHAGDVGVGKKRSQSRQMQSDSSHGRKSSTSYQERRRGIAWTEEEHRLFLLGLEKHGKGDWRGISRHFVLSRTPTQVASHAQKYFIRLNSENKERRRSSIHDITSVENRDAAALLGLIRGQKDGLPAGGSSSGYGKPPQPDAPNAGLFVHPTIGQPLHGPLIPAVGTQVNPPYPGQMVCGVTAPIPGSHIPSAPTNKASMTFPMPCSSNWKGPGY